MFSLFCFLLAILASPFKSKSRLEAENAALTGSVPAHGDQMAGGSCGCGSVSLTAK
jgi:hypothetical protein